MSPCSSLGNHDCRFSLGVNIRELECSRRLTLVPSLLRVLRWSPMPTKPVCYSVHMNIDPDAEISSKC